MPKQMRQMRRREELIDALKEIVTDEMAETLVLNYEESLRALIENYDFTPSDDPSYDDGKEAGLSLAAYLIKHPNTP